MSGLVKISKCNSIITYFNSSICKIYLIFLWIFLLLAINLYCQFTKKFQQLFIVFYDNMIRTRGRYSWGGSTIAPPWQIHKGALPPPQKFWGKIFSQFHKSYVASPNIPVLLFVNVPCIMYAVLYLNVS